MTRHTLQCEIEQLSEGYPSLFLEPHIVSCVAILSQYGPPPAVLQVSCENVESPRWPELAQLVIDLTWRPETQTQATRLLATIQRKPLVEMASCALTMLLVYHVLDRAPLDVTQYGDRADYRFLDRASVLEISGTEKVALLDRRRREKVAQALTNPMERDAYVSVCVFSESGHQIRFSFHRWESSNV
jgi:hypothetical protein